MNSNLIAPGAFVRPDFGVRRVFSSTKKKLIQALNVINANAPVRLWFLLDRTVSFFGIKLYPNQDRHVPQAASLQLLRCRVAITQQQAGSLLYLQLNGEVYEESE